MNSLRTQGEGSWSGDSSSETETVKGPAKPDFLNRSLRADDECRVWGGLRPRLRGV